MGTPSDTLIWISGATSGIGAALAQTCPHENAEIINLSRRRHETLPSIALDLTDPASWSSACEHFTDRLADFRGTRAVFIHRAFDPLWSVLEELDVPLVLHEATTMNVPQAGLDRYDNYLFLHAITHPHEHQMASLSLICGQVLERHPRLRVAFVESGCGWVPYWLERMEQHIDYWGHASLPLALRPTEYWQRQCFVSPFADETTVPAYVELLGADTLIYTSDYPYPYPGRAQMVSAMRDRADIDDDTRRKIMSANAQRLYGW